jgi:hypothetical protein
MLELVLLMLGARFSNVVVVECECKSQHVVAAAVADCIDQTTKSARVAQYIQREKEE